MSNMASATISGELTRGRRTNPVDHHSPGRCNGGRGIWASQCPRWPMRREDAPETLHLRTPSLPPPGGRARFPLPAGEGQGGGGAASAGNGRHALPKPGPIRAVEIMQNVPSHPGLGKVRPGITRCIILPQTVVTFRSSPPPREGITASTIEISLSSHNMSVGRRTFPASPFFTRFRPGLRSAPPSTSLANGLATGRAATRCLRL